MSKVEVVGARVLEYLRKKGEREEIEKIRECKKGI